MNNLDDRIQEALRNSQGDGLGIEETHVMDDLISVFRGRNRWWNTFGLVLSLVFFGLAIVCVVKFLGAEATKQQLFWGFSFSACVLSVGLVKIYFWMEMHTNRILREVKRIELLILREKE